MIEGELQALRAECRRLSAEVAALQENAELHRRLLAHIGGVAYRHDYTTDSYLHIDADIEALTGVAAADIIPKDWLWLVQETVLRGPAEGLSRSEASQRMESGTLERWDAQFRIKTCDGQTRWLADSSVPIRDAGGRTVGSFGALRDITEHKQAEEELRRSQANLSAVIENREDMFFSLDRSYRVLTINTAAREVFRNLLKIDVRPGDVLLDVLPADIAAAWRPRYDRALAGERFILMDVVNIAGEARYEEVAFDPIITEGVVSGVSIFSRNVTERRRLEERLHQSQKMEAIGRLAGGIAHDFNNLLTAILGYAELAAMESDHSACQCGPCLEQIQKAGKRAAELTAQLLAFARKQIIQPRNVNLNEAIHNIENLLRRLLGENVELVVIKSPDLSTVKIDPGQFEQILVNLIVNARDAMPQGGKVTIETRNVLLDSEYNRHHADVWPGPFVMLAVSDTGVGMGEETLAHIFEPFFTTKEQNQGTGLGLATCHGIVKQAGGHIWVYSEPDKGTIFKIYFPHVEEPASQISPLVTAGAAPQGKETILLVEDESLVREMAARALQAQGYEVLVAASSEAGLQIARDCKDSIHLLVTDVVMPQMGGSELAGRLRAERPDVKVLYVSGYTENSVVQHGVLEEGVNFLAKPFTPGALAHRVREVLDSEG
jgi:two-component system cell cycle sensor histidine kinase/response regulator CckA